MDFRLSPEEEILRKTVEEFVREELIPLEAEFENAPDIFEGSRWKSRAKLSRDPVITPLRRNNGRSREAGGGARSLVPRRSKRVRRATSEQRGDACRHRGAGKNRHPVRVRQSRLQYSLQLQRAIRSTNFFGRAFAARRLPPLA